MIQNYIDHENIYPTPHQLKFFLLSFAYPLPFSGFHKIPQFGQFQKSPISLANLGGKNYVYPWLHPSYIRNIAHTLIFHAKELINDDPRNDIL